MCIKLLCLSLERSTRYILFGCNNSFSSTSHRSTRNANCWKPLLDYWLGSAFQCFVDSEICCNFTVSETGIVAESQLEGYSLLSVDTAHGVLHKAVLSHTPTSRGSYYMIRSVDLPMPLAFNPSSFSHTLINFLQNDCINK